MKRLIKKIIIIVLIVVLLLSGLLFGAGWYKYKEAVSKTPIDDAILKIKSQEHFTPIDEIPLTFINAMIAVEDKRFYNHKGVDFIGVLRAVVKNLKAKSMVEGGSGITQQLVKNMYFINDNTITRKVAEVFIAVELEKKLSKKEILELYFNVIYYGNGYYNIYDASMGYFNKPPSKLSDYESTLLAGIPNAPSVYSLKNNPDLAKERQKTVIEAMVKMKYLTREEANMILSMQ